MAKRLTETNKWADPWFCSLNERDRLFWIYILDNCDHAGIWRANHMLINVFFPGYGQDFSRFGDRIVQVDAEKWFIPKFITFQYPGGLKKDNRAHLSVIEILQKSGLWPLPLPRKEKTSLPFPQKQDPSMPLARPIDGCKDKDKDKDKDKELVKDKDKDIPRARANIQPDEPLNLPPQSTYAIDCEWCGWVKNEANHKKCHYCFKIYTPGENLDNHRC